jgi:hypothetical protein
VVWVAFPKNLHPPLSRWIVLGERMMSRAQHPTATSNEAAGSGDSGGPDRLGRSEKNQRPRHRRRVACLVLTLAAGVLLLGLVGCTTVVTPPHHVIDPVSVYLVDYGRHSSLVFPQDENSMVEYAFGEWRWFALNDTGLLAAFRALCWSTTGTLGRRFIVTEGPAGFDHVFAGIALFEVPVEREAADALAGRLDERWVQQEDDMVYNAEYDFYFVPDAQGYHVFRNCNPVVAGWLRDLDCQVRGPALLSKWRLRRAD